MTREEAINHIKYGLIEGNYPLPKEIGIEALNMAIKALAQEPIEVEAAKLQEAYNKGYADGQRALTEHIELCKEEQEPKTGHWIMLPIMTHECSNCGIRKDYELEWNYCPNCGCRME